MRNFITITPTEYNEKLAESLRARELELLAYDFEKQNHEEALVSLGNIAWTPELEKYKGLPRDAMISRALNDGLDEQTIKLVSDLDSKDRHELNLRAVLVESSKSERQYDSILTALPAGAERDAALSAVKQKEDARAAAELGISVIK